MYATTLREWGTTLPLQQRDSNAVTLHRIAVSVMRERNTREGMSTREERELDDLRSRLKQTMWESRR